LCGGLSLSCVVSPRVGTLLASRAKEEHGGEDGYHKSRKEQFTVTAGELKHRPTGATFSIKDGEKEFAWIHWGLAGAALPNGEEYDRDEVGRMAMNILHIDSQT
jgi:hypothetical protein